MGTIPLQSARRGSPVQGCASSSGVIKTCSVFIAASRGEIVVDEGSPASFPWDDITALINRSEIRRNIGRNKVARKIDTLAEFTI